MAELGSGEKCNKQNLTPEQIDREIDKAQVILQHQQ
jgi:hypothetical protein